MRPGGGAAEDLLHVLRADLEAMRKYTGVLRHSLYPSFVCVVLYRLGHALRPTRLKPLAWLLFWLNQALTGAEIPPSADLGPGLYVVHTRGVVVSPGCRSGRRTVLF